MAKERVATGGSDHQPDWSRDRWDNPVQFLLSCIGYSVGLGNVWRFPYLCYKHGGATFLVVYLFLQLTIGKPLYFMELAIGQFSGKSPVRVWDLSPAVRGIGFAMVLVSVNISLYYNIIMTYVLYYFFASFMLTLPWNVCQPEWDNCFTERAELKIPAKCVNPTSGKGASSLKNCTCAGDDIIDAYYPNCSAQKTHSTAFFLSETVMKLSQNATDFGVPSWKLLLLMFLSWFIIGMALLKGIKSTGKVVYFTATFPYLVLLIMLVRGCLLDGAKDGAILFIVPDWSTLSNAQLWIDAAGQMFFSLSLCMGGIIMYGSYNKFTHPIYRDAVIISSMDLVTSVLAGFVIFTTLGYMAKQTGNDILKVIQSSFGLAFVAYPETLSTLSLPNFWSCLFFFMLYTLGMDSQFAMLETVMCYGIDDFVWCRKNEKVFRITLVVIIALLGIPLICPGGPYLITVLDVYGATFTLSFIGMLETIAVAWVYGINRFLADLEYMSGRKPRVLPYWYFVWVFWTPLFFFTLFLITAARSEIPTYGDGTQFGTTMLTFSWLVFVYTLLPVPLWFGLRCLAVKKRKGPFATMKEFFKVLLEPSEKWGPADGLDYSRQARGISVLSEICEGWPTELAPTDAAQASSVPATIPEVPEPPAFSAPTPTPESSASTSAPDSSASAPTSDSSAPADSSDPSPSEPHGAPV